MAEQKEKLKEREKNTVEHGTKLSNMSNFSIWERHLPRALTYSSLQNDRLDDDPILMRQAANSQHQPNNMSINVIFHLFIHNFSFAGSPIAWQLSFSSTHFFFIILLPSFHSFEWISSKITSIQLTGHRIFTHTCGYNKIGMRET